MIISSDHEKAADQYLNLLSPLIQQAQEEDRLDQEAGLPAINYYALILALHRLLAGIDGKVADWRCEAHADTNPAAIDAGCSPCHRTYITQLLGG